MLSCFDQLWCYNDLTISSFRVFIEIILVLFLGWIKYIERLNLRDDRMVPDFLSSAEGCLEGCSLIVIFVEHDGSILGSLICSLAIECCGVMKGKEYIEKYLRLNNCFIKSHAHNFSMPGTP